MSGTHPTDPDAGSGTSPHVTAPERPSSRPPAEVRELEPGTFVAGYRLITPIGAGGMGKVFLADDERLARKIALKLLPPEDGDEEGRARFLREARALARVDHENVVHVFASGVDEDIAWMALEYIEGDPLVDLLEEGALDEETALTLVAQVARGLAAVHREGVVHRDIKPDNLLLEDEGLLRIVDFGVALVAEAGGTGGFTTRSGVAVGTPHYMAPEQARGGKVDTRADVWALGATLWALLTGRPPFFHDDDETDLDILSRVLREPIVDVRERVLVSQGTAELVHRLLARDPDERPQDLDDIAEQMEALADEAMERVERGEELDESFEPIPPEAVPASAEAARPPRELDDGAREARSKRTTRDELPAHPEAPSLLARAILLFALAGLVAGGLLVAVFAISAEPPAPPPGPPQDPVPPEPTPPQDPIELRPSDPGELKLPGRPAAAPDAGAADGGLVLPSAEETAAEHRAAVREEGAAAADAAKTLASRTDEPAIAALTELVTEPGRAGGVALGAVLARSERHHMGVLEAALFGATPARQLAVVEALEQRRNVEALTLLRRAAQEHGDAAVRDAARKASRSIFSVEGEE